MIEPVVAPRRIAVFATFTGVTFMPWWYALANNSLNQRFEVGTNGIEVRVVRKRRYAWSEMASVHLRESKRGALLTVTLRGRVLTFSARLTIPAGREALALFPASVPRTVHGDAQRPR